MKLLYVIVAVIVAWLAAVFIHFRYTLKKIQDLPAPLPSAAVTQGRPTLTISVLSDSSYSVDGKELDLEGVKKLLSPNGSPVSSVHVKSPVSKSFGAAVRLLDAIRVAGIEKVSIETSPQKQN